MNDDAVLRELHDLAATSDSAASVRDWLVVDQNDERAEKPRSSDVVTVLEPKVGGDRVVLALEAAETTRYVAGVESKTDGSDNPDHVFVRYDDVDGDPQAVVERSDVRSWVLLALDTGRLGFVVRDELDVFDDAASFADGGDQGVGA